MYFNNNPADNSSVIGLNCSFTEAILSQRVIEVGPGGGVAMQILCIKLRM